MSFLFVVVLLLVAAAAMLASAKKRHAVGQGAAKLVAKPVLTEREQACYWLLVQHVDSHFRVLPQVSFSAFLAASGGNRKQNFALFATARQKVADFLIVRPDFSVVALIELDDKSHDKRKAKDIQRDGMVKSVDILVFRLPNVPTAADVQRLSAVLLRMERDERAAPAMGIAG